MAQMTYQGTVTPSGIREYPAQIEERSAISYESIKSLSVVMPVYKSAGCLDALHQRLTAVLQAAGLNYEIVFVEDCGPDDSWARLLALSAADHHVRAFRHSKNFGQHAAIATGLSQARGDYVVVMDSDLQDPPELILKFLDSAVSGNNIVFSVRSRRNESAFRVICSRIVRGGFPLYRRIPNGLQLGSFSLLSRRVVDSYLQEPDRCNYFLKILDRFPVSTGFVEYDQDARHEGGSSYSLWRLVRLFFSLVIPEYLWRVLTIGMAVMLTSTVDMLYTHLAPAWCQPLLVVADVVALCSVACAVFILLIQSRTRRTLAASAVSIGALSAGAISDRQLDLVGARAR